MTIKSVVQTESMSILEANSAALNSVNSTLNIKNSQSEQQNIEIFCSPKGYLSIKVNGLLLHSMYDPYRDVSQFLRECDLKNIDLLFIFGLGLGYHVKKLFELFDGNIIIFEPDLEVLSASLSTIDYSELILSNRVFICNDVSEIDEKYWN